jgi:hypothetical protein
MGEKDVQGSRAERLAAKLRENLRKRKAQEREMDSMKEEPTPPPRSP